MIPSMRRRIHHLLALLLFAALTIVWLWPVLSDPDNLIPGSGAGDNLTFVWNGWWMSRALSVPTSPFHTTMMFAPWGADLTLNTHTALPSLAAALLSRSTSILAATNYVIALHLFLNFALTYALAWRLTRNVGAAILAAFVVGWSPYVVAHLAGHFNLIAVWVLPLTALLLLDTLDGGGRWRAALLGAALGGAVFVEYYTAVYAALLVVLLIVGRSVTFIPQPRIARRWQRLLLRSCAVLAAAISIILVAIALTGGTTIFVLGQRISMRGTDNLIAALGVIATAAVVSVWLPRWRTRVSWTRLKADGGRLAVPVIIAAVIVSPLLLSLVRVWQRGDYVTQKYFWRSAPAGIDVSTLLLGNPGGFFWAGLPARAYSALGVDQVEQIGWLGPAVLALCVIALRSRREPSRVRPWIWVGVVFFVWALGPFLAAFGQHVHLLLPVTLQRFIPGLNNVRIPARAMVVVYCAAAMLAAHGFATLRARNARGLAALLAVLVVIDYAPAPVRAFRVEYPSVYETLRRIPGDGAVCELPLGLRDGFGQRGVADSRTLFYQTIHGRAITSGAISRLPPRTFAAYDTDPVLGPLLRLSDGRPLASERVLDPSDASKVLLAHGFRFVVLNPETSPPDLIEYVQRGLSLRPIATDGTQKLFEIVSIISRARQPSRESFFQPRRTAAP